MSAKLAKDTHRNLLAAILDGLWIQWRAMGGLTSAKRPAQSTVDVEALILVSLALSEHERRLTEVVHDWVTLSSTLLSVQRAKNIARAFPSSAADHLATLATWALDEGKDARWRPLAAKRRQPSPAPGTRRSVPKATTPDLREPTALMLRLRLGIGIGNKADVLTYLLGTVERPSTVREIAESTGYTVHALHRTVDSMATAGLIRASDESPARYTVDAKAWRTLLEANRLTPWLRWLEVYALTADFDQWMAETRERVVSDYAFSVRARELIARYRGVFRRAGVELPRTTAVREGAGESLGQFEHAIGRLTAWISESV